MINSYQLSFLNVFSFYALGLVHRNYMDDDMSNIPLPWRRSRTGSYAIKPDYEKNDQSTASDEVVIKDIILDPSTVRISNSFTSVSTSHDGVDNSYQRSPQNPINSDDIVKKCPDRSRISKIAAFMLTNVLVSIWFLLFGTGMSMGLGAYTLCSVSPSLIIDKSVKAFSIPNHKVSRGYDALHTAKSDFRKFRQKLHTRRGKRDLNNFIIDKNEDIRQMTKSQYLKLIEPEIYKMFHDSNEIDEQLRSPPVTDRQKREAKRRAGTTQGKRRWKMQLVFMARGFEEPNNVFTPGVTNGIHVEILFEI